MAQKEAEKYTHNNIYNGFDYYYIKINHNGYRVNGKGDRFKICPLFYMDIKVNVLKPS